MASKIKELSYKELHYQCDPSQFKFKSTADLKPLGEVIGQERAVSALDFGVNIKSFGYNVFALGPVGAGRTSTIKEAVEKRAREMPVPDDWCYVFNFQDAEQPNSLRLPAGKGRELAKDMERLINQLIKDIPEALNYEDYLKQRQEIIQNSQNEQNEILRNLDKRMQERGFTLRKIATGLAIFPVKDGQILSPQQIEALPPEERERLEQTGQELQVELQEELQTIRKIEQETKAKLDQLQRQIISIVIEHPLNNIRKKFQDHDEVLAYLKDVEEDMLDHVDELLSLTIEEGPGKIAELLAMNSGVNFKRYKVNLFVDNSKTKGAPVVVESNPTYNNIIGRIDRIPQMGTLITDFSMIKAGALHKANGGFLIIEALQLFQSPMAWQALKRAIKNKSVVITDLSEEYAYVSVKTLDPEPIPLDVKIIIIGNLQIYYALLAYDEEFTKLFKVKAEFNTDMPRTKSNILNYARYIAKQCQLEGLLHLDAEAVSRVVEYGVERTGYQNKLSTRLTEIHDLLVEANYWAQKNGHALIQKSDVQKALDAKKYRMNRMEVRIQEMINEGTIFINTDGEKVGEVNSLVVLDTGDYTMGKPSRLTARVFLGQSGVMAIEREVKMSGPVYNKGVLILSGYLNGQFGQDKKISMSASLTFEQSYETIDGDSASSTELYALLSCLSGYPIKQGIAVTGSVNQLGEIQPIGGVKYKIEGFFDVCHAKGLTGDQGVLIPQANVKNLQLDARVIDAVKKGKFHIYPVSNVEEGIEILTGVKAGKRQKDGKFPKGTVFYAVDEKLKQMAKQLQNNDTKDGKKKKDKKEDKKN